MIPEIKLSTWLKITVWIVPFNTILMFPIMRYMAHFLPAIPADWTAEQVKEFYVLHSTGIRIFGVTFNIVATLWCVLFTSISFVMFKMKPAPIYLAVTHLWASIVGWLPPFFAAFIWTTAAYRPERSAELVQLFNDFGWLTISIPAPVGVIQNIAIALAILQDRSKLYPRWIAYYNIAMGIGTMPMVLCVLHYTGPFAWDGLWTFTIPTNFYTTWAIIMGISTYLAARKLRESENLQASA